MAAGDPGSPARYYSSTAVETSLQSSIPAQSQGQSNTSFIVASVSGFPSSLPYTLIVDPDTSKEEVVTVTAASSTTLTVTRGADNTQAVAHSAGAVVRHGVSGRDFRESQVHIAARGYDTDSSILATANQTHVHGLATGDGDVVGTSKTQTLSNKTLSSPVITGVVGNASLVFEGATADAYETTLAITDPTADRTITLPDATGQVVLRDTTDTLTNKTLTSPTISGSPVITGLSSAGMVSSSATPKDYVDSILGSATAAATSAASAAASATAAATSATSAASSATAAATSATSASNSASAADTSATSASNSASAASTSATSAAASATAAANSVATIASYASAAATSATSAATSATSAATSASSASTSASSALTSANSAATSASSAAASFDQFDDIYLGAKAVAPTVDNDGNALQTGALYWNTTAGQMYVYSGSAWSDWVSTAVLNRFRFTAAGGETSLSGPDDNGVTLAYTVGKEQVYLNGVMLVRTEDYTATNGTSITGLSPALAASDVVEIINFQAFAVANAISPTAFDAKGDLLVASAADTVGKLTVSATNDYVLTTDSSEALGVKWAPAPASETFNPLLLMGA